MKCTQSGARIQFNKLVLFRNLEGIKVEVLEDLLPIRLRLVEVAEEKIIGCQLVFEQQPKRILCHGLDLQCIQPLKQKLITKSSQKPKSPSHKSDDIRIILHRVAPDCQAEAHPR